MDPELRLFDDVAGLLDKARTLDKELAAITDQVRRAGDDFKFDDVEHAALSAFVRGTPIESRHAV